MLSRTANSMYWLNRFMERAENYARFLDVNFNLTLELPPGISEQWNPLINTTGDNALFEQRYGEPTKKNVIHFLTFDRENPNSIISCLFQARENARSIRDSLSTDLWEHINRFYLKVKDAVKNEEVVLNNTKEFFNDIKWGSQLFYGIMDSTISNNEGWHFGRMGRFLERADKTARILDVKYYILLPQLQNVGSSLDILQWSALLKSASAFIMYRKHLGKLVPRNIIDFLVLDRRFPRAIRYCIIRSEISMHEITGTPVWNFTNMAEKSLGLLRSELDYTDIQEIINFGLHEYLDQIQLKINRVDSSINESFFEINVEIK